MKDIKRFVTQNVKEFVTLGFILLIFLAAGVARPELFSGERFPGLINSVVLWTPLNLTMALGMMMVIIIRGIDLSIGSNVALSAMVAGILFRDHGATLWQGVLVSIGIGLLCGMFNGFLIAYLRIPPIIVTLGTMNAFRGLTFIISQGKQVTGYELPPGTTDFVAKGLRFGDIIIPWLVVISLLLALGFYLMLRFTHFGREVYAVGSNREAAFLRGVNSKKTEFLVFTIVGGLCGLTAMMSASRFGYINPSNTGQGLEFVVISATIIGGVSVNGGKGTVVGTLLGCLLLGTVNTIIANIGIPGTVQRFSYGIIIVAALLLDRVVTSIQTTRRMAHQAREAVALK